MPHDKTKKYTLPKKLLLNILTRLSVPELDALSRDVDEEGQKSRVVKLLNNRFFVNHLYLDKLTYLIYDLKLNDNIPDSLKTILEESKNLPPRERYITSARALLVHLASNNPHAFGDLPDHIIKDTSLMKQVLLKMEPAGWVRLVYQHIEKKCPSIAYFKDEIYKQRNIELYTSETIRYGFKSWRQNARMNFLALKDNSTLEGISKRSLFRYCERKHKESENAWVTIDSFMSP